MSRTEQAYVVHELDTDPRHAQKRSVEILDSGSRVLARLEAHIANSSLWKKLDVCDCVTLCEMVAEIVLGDGRRQTTYKNPCGRHLVLVYRTIIEVQVRR